MTEPKHSQAASRASKTVEVVVPDPASMDLRDRDGVNVCRDPTRYGDRQKNGRCIDF